MGAYLVILFLHDVKSDQNCLAIFSNVLRLRKDAAEASAEPDASARLGLRGMAGSPITKQTAKKRADTSPGKHSIPLVSHPKDLMKIYRKQFRVCSHHSPALVTDHRVAFCRASLTTLGDWSPEPQW